MKRLQLVHDDPWLESNETEINARYTRYLDKLKSIETEYGSLYKYAGIHQELGFNYESSSNLFTYREWAPHAEKLELVGDFNNWNPENHVLKNIGNGIWELVFEPNEYFDTHESSNVKVRVHSCEGVHDRIPAYTKETFQSPVNWDFSAVIRKKRSAYQWKNKSFKLNPLQSPVIYECHIGMAQEEEKIGSFNEFRTNILPKIAKLGYNVIQMMAVQEHPYYGSFGYHVSNFFAVSSRFGSLNDLKALIDEAHKLGIAVVMDIVHSHSVKNWAEGLNFFDGTDDQYFHPGGRGEHPQWDSMIFNYGKPEVQRFLLSNIRYWLEEFRFDGFRFDGITSMLYHHHGLDTFDNYDKYFKDGVEWDAITYLQLANHLIKEIKPESLSIAEDMSGMPGLCRKNEEGGLGFDYRLGMGIPDYWIKILKHLTDEQWNLGELWGMLSNRRDKEKTIAYAESHDQALVGDKTLAFWLMDKEMYENMSVFTPSVVVDRGIALHKMIRLITSTVGGEGYLNFMGNEFGHPEWIDFPTPANNWSYQHCRRQWSLAERDDLKYKFLNNFDKEMVNFIKKEGFLSSNRALLLNLDFHNHILVYERFNFIFVFNFNPLQSFTDYEMPVNSTGKYQIALNSDKKECGGFDRIDEKSEFFTFDLDGNPKIKIYIPNRTVLVFERVG
jgi:1,4-alpha-glucan branching enzyme